jgi:ABC-type uncharacterized transport system permease subunit
MDALAGIFSVALFASAIRLATPLILAAMGGLFSERSGVINIALEGLMLAGAFTAATVTHATGSPWLGLLAGMAAGVAVAAVHALATIRYHADQVVSGTAINILMTGVPALLSGAWFASSGATPQIPQENLLPTTPIVLAFLAVPAAAWVLDKTPFGMRLRAVGEHPQAAETAGIDVVKIRWAAVLLSGALAAIGGAYLSTGQSSLFTRQMTAGRGFIALAALIFGKWRPWPTLAACLLFGIAEAVAIQMQGVTPIPVQFIQIIPYVLTVVVLAGFIGRARAPKALGIPYQPPR